VAYNKVAKTVLPGVFCFYCFLGFEFFFVKPVFVEKPNLMMGFGICTGYQLIDS